MLASSEPDRFETVLITEGEFKCGGFWQMQHWASEPVGVAAIPGINMSKNVDVRMELDRWLKDVGARKVVVVFDNEEKGDPNLPGFQADRKKRFDSEIWARYLAINLTEKNRVTGMVGKLQDDWRDAKGKADWDGVLASMVHERKGSR